MSHILATETEDPKYLTLKDYQVCARITDPKNNKLCWILESSDYDRK
jgi:hypothetical protein